MNLILCSYLIKCNREIECNNIIDIIENLYNNTLIHQPQWFINSHIVSLNNSNETNVKG